MLNKGASSTISKTSLVWHSPWLGFELGTSRTRSQHSTTRLLRRLSNDIEVYVCVSVYLLGLACLGYIFFVDIHVSKAFILNDKHDFTVCDWQRRTWTCQNTHPAYHRYCKSKKPRLQISRYQLNPQSSILRAIRLVEFLAMKHYLKGHGCEFVCFCFWVFFFSVQLLSVVSDTIEVRQF